MDTSRPAPTAEERHAIEALLHRYATAVDEQRWELLREVFTPDAAIDYASTGGRVGALDDLLPWLASTMARFRILQHFVSNVRVEPCAEGVRVTSYVLAKHGYKRDGAMVFFSMGGEYEDLVVRRGQELRIARRTLRARWFEGTLPPP